MDRGPLMQELYRAQLVGDEDLPDILDNISIARTSFLLFHSHDQKLAGSKVTSTRGLSRYLNPISDWVLSLTFCDNAAWDVLVLKQDIV